MKVKEKEEREKKKGKKRGSNATQRTVLGLICLLGEVKLEEDRQSNKKGAAVGAVGDEGSGSGEMGEKELDRDLSLVH